MSVWDTLTDRAYRRFPPDGVAVITFEQDEPTVTTNKYNQTQYDFEVDGDLLFGVSSKGLMRLLKKHRPLTGKTLKISRTGRGFETQYAVEVIEGNGGDEQCL